jgi:hypothetical protein
MDPSWAKFYPKGEDSGPDGLEEAKKLWLRETLRFSGSLQHRRILLLDSQVPTA